MKIPIIYVLQLIYIKENGKGTKMIPVMREIPLKMFTQATRSVLRMTN